MDLFSASAPHVDSLNTLTNCRSQADRPTEGFISLQDIEQTGVIESTPEDDLMQLQAAMQAHGVSVPDDQAAKLAKYCRLLWDWNTRLNLTRHTDWDLFVTRDLLDTMELSKHIPENSRVMDVGSGGGVPGIPLAILRPDVKMSLCDSIGKKAMALQDIVKSLGLKIQVHSDRAEAILKRYHFILSQLVLWLPSAK